MSHDEFGLQLLKNKTVKQHKNDHSGTWEDVEQEFAEIFDSYDFLKYVFQYQVSQAKTCIK